MTWSSMSRVIMYNCYKTFILKHSLNNLVGAYMAHVYFNILVVSLGLKMKNFLTSLN